MKIEMAPSVVLENLEDLYFELVPKHIDLRKKRPTYLSKEKKKSSQLLDVESIKEAFFDIDRSKLKNIYLIGSEPIFNPDFNKILRLCLKIAPTTVITGAQNINEKKARFLEKVQNENEKNHALNFNIILYHYDERINDTYCTRGDFRKVLHAITSLEKYDFSPKIIIKNITNCPETELLNGFEKIFKQFNISTTDFYIENLLNDFTEIDNSISKKNFMTLSKNLHCAKSRVFSSAGVYSCPNLVGDNRGRLGSNFKAYAKRNYLETESCKNCLFHKLHT